MAKKGKVQAQNNKQLKEELERRRDFFERLERMLDDFGGKGTYAMIPPRELIAMYLFRPHSIRIVNPSDFTFPPKLLREINKYFSIHIRFGILNQLPNNRELSIRDFTTIWMCIQMIVMRSKHDDEQWCKDVTNRVSEYFTTAVYNKLIDQLYIFLDLFSYEMSQVPKFAVWFNLKIGESANQQHILWDVCLNVKRLPKKQIQYQNEERTAYPVFIPKDADITQITFRLNEIGKKCAFGDLSIEVYVMEHAIKRMKERLIGLRANLINSHFIFSLLHPVFHYESDNRILIEFKFLDSKLGYFVAEYVEGILLIKTFLFLTNNGTPEGRRLNEATGLSKFDKKYLQIDKLSTFFESDIETNEHLKKIFVDAGCGSLFDYKNYAQENDKPVAHIASFIDHYLTTGEFNEDMNEEEE